MQFVEQTEQQKQFKPDFAGRQFIRIIFWVAALVLAIALAFYLLFQAKISMPLSHNAAKREFTVVKGQNVRQISRHLYEEGFISSPLIFNLYLYFTDNAGKIPAGSYLLSANMSMRQVAKELISGNVRKLQEIITIKEGWTVEDIGDYLDQRNIVSKTAFIKAVDDFAKQQFDYFGETPKKRGLEGYLFPDTYFIKKGATSREIIKKIIDNTSVKLDQRIRADILKQGKNIYDILTLASIVEKEVGRNTERLSAEDSRNLQNERTIMAGVFYNRLKIAMPLESDATITYITKKNNPSAEWADLKIDSLYNTYKYSGLPLGPISNPSLSAILAAVYPAPTNYLFFLTKPDGTAVFAKTFQEHLKNRNIYLNK